MTTVIIFSFLIGLWFLRHYKIKKPTKTMAKSYFVFALPIMLIAVIGVISTNVDKIMIGYFWTKVEVGYYFTVQQVLEIITVLALAVEAVLFPTLSEFHSLKNFEGIKIYSDNQPANAIIRLYTTGSEHVGISLKCFLNLITPKGG